MNKFEGVANTAFVPLVARIQISRRFPDFFCDQKALDLARHLPAEAEKGAFEYASLASVARSCHMDDMTRDFIVRHAPCNIIFLGAGLESAYFRLTQTPDLPQAAYYEIDLPPVIQVRRQMFGEQPHEKLIAGDLFTLEWLQDIKDKALPTLLLASGVFHYFTKADILTFIRRLAAAFPEQELIFDATSTEGLRFTNRFIKRTGNAHAVMRFGIDDAKAFAQESNTALLEERLFFPEIRKKLGKRIRLITRLCMRLADKRKNAVILRLRLDPPQA